MAGVDLVSVWEALGHPDTETTMRCPPSPRTSSGGSESREPDWNVTKAVIEEEEEEEPEEAMPPIVVWCARRDLNPQPSDPKSDALSN